MERYIHHGARAAFRVVRSLHSHHFAFLNTGDRCFPNATASLGLASPLEFSSPC